MAGELLNVPETTAGVARLSTQGVRYGDQALRAVAAVILIERVRGSDQGKYFAPLDNAPEHQ